MELLRVLDDTGRPVVAVRDGVPPGDGGPPAGDGAPLRRVDVADLAELLARPLAELREIVTAAASSGAPVRATATLAPVDGATEVWASGVTYLRSRDARTEESSVADVYERVYDADRPELFFKSVAAKVVGDGAAVGIREDSAVDVPEPELALVITAHGEIAGLTICNDMSSRTIEGENPLYLPQAKIYAGACALGPVIRPIWELDALGRTVRVEIRRDGATAFAGSVSTDSLRRRPADLVEHLFRGDHFPAGAVLSTGTGVVPDLPFTLTDGDVVSISIDGIGTLSNPVRRGKQAFAPGT